MVWIVCIGRKAKKQIRRIPSEDILTSLRLLADCLRLNGPYPGKKWPNYGKLMTGKGMDKRHCHLTKGRPTYVCCWEVIDKQKKIIEVYYVGTHEKAPY